MNQKVLSLFDRTYHVDHYNCTHFVIEAWRVLFDEDISDRFDGVAQAFNADKKIKRSSMRLLREIEKPTDDRHCIVCFQRNTHAPHVGIFFGQKVLHITEGGVQYLELHKVAPMFQRVSFYV